MNHIHSIVHNFLVDWKKEYNKTIEYLRKFIHSNDDCHYILRVHPYIRFRLIHYLYKPHEMTYGFLVNEFDYESGFIIELNFYKAILRLKKIYS